MKLLAAGILSGCVMTGTLAQAQGTKIKEDLLMVALALEKFRQDTVLDGNARLFQRGTAAS